MSPSIESMRFAFPVIFCLIGGPFPAAAQSPETREEALRQEREAKAAALVPNEPDALQRGFAMLEERGLFLTERDGWHPKLGRLTTGSGFAIGVGFRNRAIFARRGTLDLFTAGSFRKYWAIETRATFPDLARGRVFAEGVASLREYPNENFFGLGPDSRLADHTTFMLRTARAGGRAALKFAPLATIGGGLDLLKPRAGRGRDDDHPSMAERFDVQDAPGMDTWTDFVRSSAFIELDYRRPRNARQGGLYRVEVSHFADRTSGLFTFSRTDIDLRQYIGFLAGRRVIALRGVASSSTAADGSEVPFYLMPFLGGKDTLRGFRNYRFRGPHMLLVEAEYRWEIWSGLEGALFYDTGKVARTRRELNLEGLQRAYGFGFRFNTDNAIVMRFDAAFGGREGKRLHMSLGGVF